MAFYELRIFKPMRETDQGFLCQERISFVAKDDDQALTEAYNIRRAELGPENRAILFSEHSDKIWIIHTDRIQDTEEIT